MRILSLLKHCCRKCQRVSSRRYLICLFLFLFCFTYSFSSFNNPVHLSSSLNHLDECMYDVTPCYPDIDQSLNRYFKKYKDKYSMLLTYHPKIDCNHGRYLLINNVRSLRVHHGTGSALMWYLGVLNIAYQLNLTLIHFDWIAEHSDDENNVEREKYWLFSEWQIPYSAYQSCPMNSSIKKNIFSYNLIPNQTLDQHHEGKQPFTIKSHLRDSFSTFLTNLTNKNDGFTFYSRQTITITSSLMELGIVMEIRWWLQHRKSFQYPHGVWAGVSIPSSNQPIDYFSRLNQKSPIKCRPIDLTKSFLIGVHIRHGDVVKRNSQGRILFGDLYRYISHSAYAPFLTFLIKSLPDEIRKKSFLTIYSEGHESDFDDILNELKETLPELQCRMLFILNGRTSETFNRLLRDDVLIHASSTFSLASGIFNSRQLKIGPKHNQGRVHGMRNFLQLDLDLNHTKFQLTNERQILIEKRIRYVWNEKQKQSETFVPLWLKNYLDDYPEEFMLI